VAGHSALSSTACFIHLQVSCGGVNQVSDCPDGACHTRLHCWRHSKCFVYSHEVEIREMQRDRSFKILQLFAESVCQAGEAAAVHPHREVLAFDLAG